MNVAQGVTADGAVSSLKSSVQLSPPDQHGYVRLLVTEHGAVDLFELTLRQRAVALIAVARRNYRVELRRSFAEVRSVVLGAAR